MGQMSLFLKSSSAARRGLILLACFGSVLPAAPQKRAVAVMNFQNVSGSRSLDYLRTALPESVSGVLAASPEVRVVERTELNKVLKEIELEQSGVIDTGQVTRAGKLVRADVLLIGSFSGNAEKMTVTLKAVEVATGVVLEGRAITAPLADILEQSGQAALALAASVAGGKTGNLTVLSNPDGAEVRVDGVVVGKTPVVEYRLSAGKHRVFISKSGYKAEEHDLTVRPGSVEKLSESLSPSRKSQTLSIGVGYQRVIPPGNTLQQGNLIVGHVGIAFGKWMVDLTYALNPSWDHSYPYASSFGTLTNSRSYLQNSYLLGIAFEPFEFQYFSPYVGIFGGYTRVSDYELTGSDNTSSRLASYDLLQLGGKIGIEIMPRQLVSFFIEGRYQYFPKSISRTTRVSQGITGGPLSVPGEINLSSLSIGGGVRLNF